MTKSKDDKGFGEQYVSEFTKILLSEISQVLKSHNIPVNNDTKRAFMAGASTSQTLSLELFNKNLWI